MKHFIKLIIYATFILLINGCNKNGGPVISGEATIDNLLYGTGPYYAVGFSFEQGKELQTNNTPEPDITIHAILIANGQIEGAYLDTPNHVESFALAGEFGSSSAASSFFSSFTDVGQQTWISIANNIKLNQIWVFKTRDENYVKIRIKDMVVEDRMGTAYAEFTFQWKIQPDGSQVFSK